MSNSKQTLDTGLFGFDRTAVDQAVIEQNTEAEAMERFMEAQLAQERSQQEQFRLLLSQLQDLAESQETLDVELGDVLRQADETGQFVTAALSQYVHLLEGEAAERHRTEEARISALAGQAARVIEQLEQIASQIGTLATGTSTSSESTPAQAHTQTQAHVQAPAYAQAQTQAHAPAPNPPAERRPELVRPAAPKNTAPEPPVRRVLPFRTAPVEPPVADTADTVAEAAPTPAPAPVVAPTPALSEWRPGDVSDAVGPAESISSAPPGPLPAREPGLGSPFTVQAASAQTPSVPQAQPAQPPVPKEVAAPVQVTAPVQRVAPVSPSAPAQAGGPAPVAPPAPAVQGTSEVPPTQVEAGIKQRLALNMSRMLEGKAVGQELRDGSGAILANRGTLITPELAARAEAAGVLADLILHMAWPEEVDV